MKTQIVNGNGGMPVVEDNLQLFSRSPRKALSEMQELVKVMSDKCQGDDFIAIINNRKYFINPFSCFLSIQYPVIPSFIILISGLPLPISTSATSKRKSQSRSFSFK